MGREKHNNQQLHLRLPAELCQEARRKAKRERRPLSEVIRDLLRQWLAAGK
jgi:hypothetical protein